MGQLRLAGPDAAAAFESLMPVDVIGLRAGQAALRPAADRRGHDHRRPDVRQPRRRPVRHRQRRLQGGRHRAHAGAHRLALRDRSRCPTAACSRCRARRPCDALKRAACPASSKLVFMTGGAFRWNGADLFITRSGYTGEDGFEISVHGVAGRSARARAARAARGEAGRPGRAQFAAAGSGPVPVRQRHRHDHHAGRSGAELGDPEGAPHAAARAPAASPAPTRCWASSTAPCRSQRKRVGLVALERVPVREHTELQDAQGQRIGEVTSGLLGPTIDKPIAMGYVPPRSPPPARGCTPWCAASPCRWKSSAMPFVPNRYYRG